MDADKQQELYEDKYQDRLGISWQDWLETGPSSQHEAYERCQAIDDELKRTEDEWRQALGDNKDHMESYREKLRLEYELIEAMFGLESDDE